MFKSLKYLAMLAVLPLLPANPALAEPAKEGLGEDLVNPGYEEKPAWFKNSFLDLREDIAEAAAQNRHVMLYFYQDGCPYCAKLLRDNFAQKLIVDKTRKNFDVIAINMWGDREVTDLDGTQLTEKQFASKLKVMFTPTILMLDKQGRLALRINGYYYPEKFSAALDYVSTPVTGMRFREYYAKLKPVRASGKLHDEAFFLPPPYKLDQLVASNKPLMLLFEQKQCKACDELHNDIFKRKETLEQLRRFNIVRFDMWGKTPVTDFQGNRTTAEKLAKKLNIKYAPSMVFFDNKGNEVFRAEAYLKSFHIQSLLDYVASGAYKTQPNFQRYIAARADRLEAQGKHIDLWD